MATQKTQEQIVRRLQDMLDSATRQRDLFVQKLQENPGYAMSWSSDMFTAAAEIEFAQEALAFFDRCQEDRDPVQILIEDAQQTVFRLARSASNKSTSVASNYMTDCCLEVRARFLDDIRFL